MSSELQFILSGLALIAIALVVKVGPKNVINFFGSKEKRPILNGVLFAIGFCLVAVAIGLLTGCSGSYLNHASAYAGLEEPMGGSPVCWEEGGDQMTSNLGARLNLYQSEDGKFSANGKYTHHSCAFGPDGDIYDALGAELEYRFFERE